MNVDEWGLSPRQNERLRAVLEDDERVVMVAKPRKKMNVADAFFQSVPGWALLVFMGGIAYQFGEQWWVVALLFSPFWMVALVMISGPLRYRFRMVHTLYVLTNRRALVWEQLSLWRNRFVNWPLFPGLVKKFTKDDRNLGSMIFDYEWRWAFDRKLRRVPMPVGFLRVPQPEQVKNIIEEQVAAVPQDEAPFAYRPSVLRSPAPRLDAWGSPCSQQPGKSRDDSGFLFAFATVWLLIASCLVVVGLCMQHTERRLAAEGKQTLATVLEMRESSSSGRNSSVSYFPTLNFADDSGQVHTVEYGIGTDNYPVGHQLTIVYLPGDVDTLRIVKDGMSPGTQFLLGGGLFVMVGCGLLAIAFRLRKK
ncbi:MAG: DUF3592 domain-containing protein [Akkermansia sp.]|nr:DUF3592 domain-containing protein [Akkermansia sp.]